MSAPSTVQIMSPVPQAAVDRASVPPPLRSLQGRVVGLRIEWTNFGIFLDRFEQRLLEDADVVTKRWDLIMDKRVQGRADRAPRKAEFEAFAAGIDTAIVGLAACGSCTAWSIDDAVNLIARGIPTVVVATDEFEGLCRSLAKFHGYPDLPLLIVPHPFHTLQEDVVLSNAEEKVDELYGMVVQPRVPATV
jgi:hypothetical protein